MAVFCLGQASPHLQALTQARAAAYLVWEVIDAVSGFFTSFTHKQLNSFAASKDQ